MVYRNDVDALEARHATLAAEVAERTRERDEVAHMLAFARAADDHAREIAARPARRRRRQRVVMLFAITALAVLAGVVQYRLSHPKPDRVAEAVRMIEAFTNDMCSCATRECATKVTDAMTAWGTEMAKGARDDVRPDEAVTKHLTAVVTRYSECMTKLMATPPQAE